MFKRCELHNHTTESDAHLSCGELIELMEREQVDIFALTDHNTVSGHQIVRSILDREKHSVRCVYGMEYTTYYGHILCQNLKRYVPWDSINRHEPEALFRTAHDAGALVGIAHPFAFGDPFARGCRFEMSISDFSQVDYIEIINNQERLYEVNKPGMDWWEQLCLSGEKIAATAGMDLHRNRSFAMTFATYIEGEADGDPEMELIAAVKSCKTWLSKGMLLLAEQEQNGYRFRLTNVRKPGFEPGECYIMTLRTASGIFRYDFDGDELYITEDKLPGDEVLIPRLYKDAVSLENLICVSPVIRTV